MNKSLLIAFVSLVLSFGAVAQCPIIEGAMVNSCGTGEGVNEFLIFRTTASAQVSAYTLYYGSNNPPKPSPTAVLAGSNARTANGSGSIVAAGCSITYVTSPTTVIPANARVVFIPSDYTQAYDLGSICNGGSIYVVFINRTASPSIWLTGGNFGNNPPADRYLQVVNGSNNCTSNIVSYTFNWPVNDDGNFVTWSTAGVPTYANNGCSIIPPLEPVNITPTIAPVCIGATSASMSFTTVGSPNQYGITWNAAALSAGFVNVTNATLPASPLTISIPTGAAAGSYTGSLTVTNTATGVSSTAQNITVTIKPKTSSTTNVAVCQPQLPYSWNGNSYNTAGTYTKTLTNSAGCDSVATLVLTVKPTSTSTTNVSVCASALPYSWNGNSYNSAGTYTKTLTNSAGCDSVATLVLTVKPTSTSTTNVSVCASALPYSWNGNSYNAAGTYTKTLTNSAGCDSVATLVLTVKPTSTSTTNVSVCPSALPYSWNGNTYTTAGTYTKTLVNVEGCDSVATLVLNVNATSTSTTNVAICPSGLPYSWNGNTYTTAGTYVVNLTGTSGCDSAATLILSVKANTSSTTNVSVCPAALPYSWNGNTYTTAGTYTKTLVNAEGCDSVVTLVLSVNTTSTSTTNVAVCPSALPYSWNGNTYTAAGTYTVNLTGTSGCDSAATLILSVKANTSSITNVSVCPAALPYSWNGNTYNAAGTYTKTLVNAEGCDSVATLVLNVNATSTSTTNVAVCPSGLPYSWNGNTYTAAGTYVVNLTGTSGCDSAATLLLSVKANTSSITNVSVCPAALPYSWNGNTYTTSGTYTKTLVNAEGCDSVATLVLLVNATSTSTTNVAVCPSGLPYSWNGNTYTAAGTYVVNLTGTSGCDSAATLLLSVKANTSSTTNVSVCPAALPYSWNGNTYTTAGTYTKTLVNAAGCDSVATLVLSVNATSTSTTNVAVCPSGLPYSWNGNTYTAAGTYVVNLTGTSGCDSAATLILSVKANTSSTTNVSVCPAALPYSWNGNTYNAAGTYTKTLVNAEGCDSVATLVLNVNATSTSTTNVAVCPSGLPYSWNGNTYTAAGTYVVNLTGTSGCDSVATLVLTISATSASTTPVGVCPGQLPYTWNGNTYTTAGTYSVTLTNSAGCDSVATLVLTLNNTSASTTNVSVCPSALPYSWNGNTYTTAGTYTKTLTNSAGCDSVATLVLTVKANSASTTNVLICAAALPYVWNGNSYTAAGTYNKTLVNAAGCDSVATLVLVVTPTATNNSNVNICKGAIYNGVVYNANATLRDTIKNSTGCDSIYNITTITINELQLSISANPNPAVSGNNVSITTSAPGPYTVTSWTPATLFPAQTALSQTIVADINRTITVTGISALGCGDTASINIVVSSADLIYIPNTFTPNSDGRNDAFRVYGNNIKAVELKIFSQWGEMLFDGRNQLPGWDGTYKGEPQPVGVYVYAARITLANGTILMKKGSINLVR